MTPQLVVSEVLARHARESCFLDLMQHATLIMREPADPVPVYRLADLCQRLNDFVGCRQLSEAAFALQHRTKEQLYCRARAKIRLGDWSGWADYEVRQFGPMFVSLQTREARTLRWAYKAWDGKEDLRDRVLLVVAEQGYGDTIQMLRFVSDVCSRAGRVILVVPPPLVSLTEHNLGHIATIATKKPDSSISIDRYVWLMSLPSLKSGLPGFTPLTAPQPALDLKNNRDRLQVGICWTAAPGGAKDEHRSVPIDALEPLFTRADVQWCSLQTGESVTESDAYPQVSRPIQSLDSFADTANLIAGLDCVVTVDTAVAHLAGSLGVPTLLLLNTAASWRWGLEDASPWYPSLRLVRQRQFGEWSDVVATTSARLDQLTASPNPTGDSRRSLAGA